MRQRSSLDLRDVLKRLEARYSIDMESFVAPRALEKGCKPFEVLVGIVLSQNTSDKNAIKAFEALRSELGGEIDPKKLLELDEVRLANVIKVAGQQRRRARLLKELARFFVENPRFFEELESMDVEKARAALLSLPGVGPKTADVFLLMYLRKKTFPIDTHILRVASRLGLGNSYEDIRRRVLELGQELTIEELIKLHLLLIQHGREICRPRNPKCEECVLRDLCKYASCTRR